jgi:hypothetical protein
VLNVDKKKTEEEDADGLYLAETCGCVNEDSGCAGLQLELFWLMNIKVRTK